jgi:polyferredoxin
MPTICPNCLRPVRTDAKYCGFCGTNLKPNTKEEAVVAVTPPQKDEGNIENQATQKQRKTTGRKIRRIVLILLIVLLCVVLLVAFLLHYWPILSPYIDAILRLLSLR